MAVRPGSMRDRVRHDGGNPQPSRPAAQRQPYDPSRAPAGYDQAYWGMAVLFRDLADKDVNLRAGPPVIYAELVRIFGWFELETGRRPFQRRGDGSVELMFRQMYRDGTGKRLTWEQVGYAIIEEFWSRTWDDDALAWFCDKAVLEKMATVVVERWLNERQRALRADRPGTEPEPMTWNRDGHKRRARSSDDA